MKADARRATRERVGVFGGTFDPPHIGHLALAEWARVRLSLDRVLFVPAGTPPHKRTRGLSPARDRIAMTRLAVRDNSAFEVSTLETRRRGPSYTADTVRVLAAERPDARLWLLMGADMFETFAQWVRPEEILAYATIAVALRPGARAPHSTRWSRVGRGVDWLDNPGLEVSSSVIRSRAARGRSVRYLVPDAVARFVERRGLYRSRSAA